MIKKCPCQYCNINIEFDTEDFKPGNTINCPKCGLETTLFLPAPAESPDPPIPAKPAEPEPVLETVKPSALATKKSPSTTMFFDFVAVSLFLIGAGLVIAGCSGEFNEAAREDGSAIRQNVCAVQYGAGFITVALSCILSGICRLVNKD